MQPEATLARSQPPRSALVLGLALIAAGVIGIIQLSLDPFLADIDAGAADPGPAFFPRFLLFILIASGLGQVGIVLISAIRFGRFASDPEFSLSRLAIPAALVASVYIYAKLLPQFGYLAATVIFALAWLAIVGWFDRSLPKNPLAAAALVALEAFAISGILFAVFGYGIAVPLP